MDRISQHQGKIWWGIWVDSAYSKRHLALARPWYDIQKALSGALCVANRVDQAIRQIGRFAKACECWWKGFNISWRLSNVFFIAWVFIYKPEVEAFQNNSSFIRWMCLVFGKQIPGGRAVFWTVLDAVLASTMKNHSLVPIFLSVRTLSKHTRKHLQLSLTQRGYQNEYCKQTNI